MSATLADALPRLEVQLADAKAEARAAQERAEALEQVVGGIKRLNGHAEALSLTSGDAGVLFSFNPAPTAKKANPRGREAVRAVTGDRPGIWPLKDLVAEVMRREWADSPKSVEVAVHRLTRAGEARRVGIGVYEFPGSDTEVNAP